MDNFWKKKKLSEFTTEEWEALCMRCGKCCLLKYSDEKNIYFSNGICSKFDLGECKCSVYNERLKSENCKKVDIDLLQNSISLLPSSCPYRLLWEGKDLPEYHPLVCGDFDLVHKLNKTVKEMSVLTEAERVELVAKQFQELDVPRVSALSIAKECVDEIIFDVLETYPLN